MNNNNNKKLKKEQAALDTRVFCERVMLREFFFLMGKVWLNYCTCNYITM